jgi:hypothetical protein
MFGEEIVKVTGNTCGHNYMIGDFYTISRVQAQPGYHRLEPILPDINVQGLVLQTGGNNIQSSDFIRVDPFNDNEELITFLREKEAVLLTSVVGAVENAISFKEEIKKIADFDNKEDYVASRIQACKDSFSEEDVSDDEQSKKILTLLSTLA